MSNLLASSSRCWGVAVAGVAGVAGRGTSALLTGIAHREWSIFRYKVEQIIAEMDCSDFPKPTRRMCLFLVAGEDRRFYYHPGVDPVALGRAVWKTVFCGCRQGGSTIAMQIVRTVDGALRVYLSAQVTGNDSRSSIDTPHRSHPPACSLSLDRLLWLADERLQAGLSKMSHRPDFVRRTRIGNACCSTQVSGNKLRELQAKTKNPMSSRPSIVVEDFNREQSNMGPFSIPQPRFLLDAVG